MFKPNDEFNIANQYLGWGDPDGGLWCIGTDEGTDFTSNNLEEMKGRQFDYLQSDKKITSPVATVVAKIASRLSNAQDWEEYRDKVLWRQGSKVFNGNILPLGKASRKKWPLEYKQLFGIESADDPGYLQLVRETRYKYLQNFRDRYRPQAIICFGKSHWPEFESIFAENPGEIGETGDFKIYAKNRVLLTKHFAWSVHMTNEKIEDVIIQLRDWGVDLSN